MSKEHEASWAAEEFADVNLGDKRLDARLVTLDRVILVDDRPAYAMANRLALEEGLFVGMSSGAAVWAALEVASELSPDNTVVVLLPDRGDRYLSTSLFRSVCAECPP